MKILLVSDSHGNFSVLNKLYNAYPKMDLYLHAGDSEQDEFSLYPFLSVKGNCDYLGNFQESITLPLEDGFLFIQHDPNVDFKMLKTNNVKLFIHGHTHRRKKEIIDDILIINPGAITNSRDGNNLSYVTIETNKSKIDVHFHLFNE